MPQCDSKYKAHQSASFMAKKHQKRATGSKQQAESNKQRKQQQQQQQPETTARPAQNEMIYCLDCATALAPKSAIGCFGLKTI
mmetsp:Transcript_28023/g.55073  ORF Transcript_28023/g.55073 Transcript_28023/m.55073 type:complete len:83 (-) Transcript_28023:51-299(-)